VIAQQFREDELPQEVVDFTEAVASNGVVAEKTFIKCTDTDILSKNNRLLLYEAILDFLNDNLREEVASEEVTTSLN